MSQPRTFIKRFYLDKIFNRSTQDNSNHWVGTTLKAFRVIATNNENFELDITADPDSGSIQGIPLGEVRLHNYTTIAKNAVVENKTIQADVWVDILFSVEDELVWTGAKSSENEKVIVTEGSNHSSARKDINNVVSVLVPANDERVVATIQHKSGGSIWIGNPLELEGGDYQNICVEITPGQTFTWKNAGALNAICESEAVLAVLEETI